MGRSDGKFKLPFWSIRYVVSRFSYYYDTSYSLLSDSIRKIGACLRMIGILNLDFHSSILLYCPKVSLFSLSY